MLNRYVWQLYLKAGGENTVSFFQRNLEEELSGTYAEQVGVFQGEYCASSGVVREAVEQLKEFYSDNIKDPLPPEKTVYSDDYKDADAAHHYMDKEFQDWYQQRKSEAEGSDKDLFDWFSARLTYLSTAFAVDYPGLFIPYYFFANYNILAKIAEVFGINMPPLPKKADYKGRIWHYVEICKSMLVFRLENELSPSELCAFLYDFAPRYIGGTGSYIIEELPEPRSAYFIGGGGDNADATAEDNPDEICFWQCNPGTRAGDMIVMYLRTPISAVSSIWRSMSVGFIDPFFYYYRCTYIGKPVKVKRFGIKQLKADESLGKMPIVQKNMQGVNGIELMPSEYNRLAVLTDGKVPLLEYVMESGSSTFENEKAVEEKLIKPLIRRLGYSEEDYVQQLYIEIGNHNHALIPDFVLYPNSAQGHYSAFSVIEAKRSIPNTKQLEETKTQVRSYAKLLGARYAVIASKEKVWVMSAKDDYSDAVFEATWDQLASADIFYSLNRLIGGGNKR